MQTPINPRMPRCQKQVPDQPQGPDSYPPAAGQRVDFIDLRGFENLPRCPRAMEQGGHRMSSPCLWQIPEEGRTVKERKNDELRQAARLHLQQHIAILPAVEREAGEVPRLAEERTAGRKGADELRIRGADDRPAGRLLQQCAAAQCHWLCHAM